MKKIRVSLADNEPLFRKGVSLLLKSRRDIEVVFEASNGKELLGLLERSRNKPDIIIMDIDMPIINGMEATKIIQNDFPDIKIIILTNYRTKAFIANLIHLGAASYIVKSATPQELVNAVHEVYRSGSYYDDGILKAIKAQPYFLPKRKISEFHPQRLTNREVQVLKLICRQYTSLEIANKLFLSPRTVEGHKSNLLRKTECKNMIGLIVYALLHDHVSMQSLMANN